MIRKFLDKIAHWLGYTSNHEIISLNNELEFAKEKNASLVLELESEKEKFRVHKELTDKITDDFNALKNEQMNAMLDQFVLKVKTLTQNDKIVVISTTSVAMHDYNMFSRINNYLRTACPWLDLIFMVPKGYDFATMTRADLLDLGLMPIERPVTEEEIV